MSKVFLVVEGTESITLIGVAHIQRATFEHGKYEFVLRDGERMQGAITDKGSAAIIKAMSGLYTNDAAAMS